MTASDASLLTRQAADEDIVPEYLGTIEDENGERTIEVIEELNLQIANIGFISSNEEKL